MSTFDRDFYTRAFDNVRLASETLGGALPWREQMMPYDTSLLQKLSDQSRYDEAIRQPLVGYTDVLANFRAVSEHIRIRDELLAKQFITSSHLAFAQEQARVAQSLALPSTLEAFRTGIEPLSAKLLALNALDVVQTTQHLEAFTRASAVSDLIAQSLRVDHEYRSAIRAFSLSSIPAFDTLAGYRFFLDAAGLVLPRWPKLRLLSKAEKHRRFKAQLRSKAEPPHLKKAKSLVHRYELTLREILDAVMTEAYGEDWPETRLPLCGCKNLLGRWHARGGNVLDHADYAHYAQIMSYPDHFATIFETGFDEPAALATLLNQAGRLRAASHHGHVFTPNDLRDLRVTWRTIETGLVALTDDYELERA